MAHAPGFSRQPAVATVGEAFKVLTPMRDFRPARLLGQKLKRRIPPRIRPHGVRIATPPNTRIGSESHR